MKAQLEAIARVCTMLSALRDEIQPPHVTIANTGYIDINVTRPVDPTARVHAVDRIAAVLGVEGKGEQTQRTYMAYGNGVTVHTTTVPRCDACGAVKPS